MSLAASLPARPPVASCPWSLVAGVSSLSRGPVPVARGRLLCSASSSYDVHPSPGTRSSHAPTPVSHSSPLHPIPLLGRLLLFPISPFQVAAPGPFLCCSPASFLRPSSPSPRRRHHGQPCSRDLFPPFDLQHTIPPRPSGTREIVRRETTVSVLPLLIFASSRTRLHVYTTIPNHPAASIAHLCARRLAKDARPSCPHAPDRSRWPV